MQTSSTIAFSTWIRESSATVKRSNQANSINPEHLFLMILVNFLGCFVALFFSILSVGLERSIQFDWFDCVRKSNLIGLLSKFLVLLCSITELIEPNRSIEFEKVV